MNKLESPQRGKYSAFPFLALAGVALSLGFQGAAQETFAPKGRLITEGRIFGVACHDFDKDGRR